MGISGSDAGVSVCGRAQLHLCQRFRVEHAAVGFGTRPSGMLTDTRVVAHLKRVRHGFVSVLLLLRDCRGKGSFHFKQTRGRASGAVGLNNLG
jgi:hypothetical protein